MNNNNFQMTLLCSTPQTTIISCGGKETNKQMQLSCCLYLFSNKIKKFALIIVLMNFFILIVNWKNVL